MLRLLLKRVDFPFFSPFANILLGKKLTIFHHEYINLPLNVNSVF